MTSNPDRGDRRDEAWWYSRAPGQPTFAPGGTFPYQQISATEAPPAQQPGLPQPVPQDTLPPQAAPAQPAGPVEPQAASPRIDLLETPDEILVVVELPGFDEDDVVLEGLNQEIRITAERSDDYDEGRLYVRERPLHLERTVSLPNTVSIEDAEASFDDGVCEIRFPKREETRTHRIGFQ